MFKDLIRKRELEQRIAILQLEKDGAVKGGEYQLAAEIRDRMDSFKKELNQCLEGKVTLAELEKILNLFQMLASKVTLGDFVSVMADENFKDLRPLIGQLFPDLKILFEEN